jgi:NAD(P)-dependent dehydrogenase (short-subunit alcohol dehydrogenase family)
MALAVIKSTETTSGATALVIGAAGGIGAAFVNILAEDASFDHAMGLSRHSNVAIDICDEDSVAAAAKHFAASELRLVIVATGLLQGQGIQPEKSWRDLNAAALAKIFAVNTIGPALILKHFLPLLPRTGKSVVALLSARVGSIEDNRLGGWYGYRAAKAALNQIIRTASVELARTRPDAICVALHPGTVDTPLSAPFAKAGLNLQSPEQAAMRLLQVVKGLSAADSGGFFDHMGERIPF